MGQVGAHLLCRETVYL